MKYKVTLYRIVHQEVQVIVDHEGDTVSNRVLQEIEDQAWSQVTESDWINIFLEPDWDVDIEAVYG